jgi:hypothetical protein
VSAWGDAFTESVRARCVAILASASEPGGVRGAEEHAEELASLVAAWASPAQMAAVGWAEGTAGVLAAARSAGVTALGGLGGQAEFCVELGLLVQPGADDVKAVMRLAERLASERAEAVGTYPALAAAVCVVHERPFTRRINENSVAAPDAIEVFDYFVRNAGAMQTDLTRMPALLLVHVVDVTESVEQLEWALRAYGRQPAPGQRFFEIEYDYDAFRRGATKKVTAAGDYRLESIKRHGGVCADQAYFAESVGKAAGIPTCYVRAVGADVSHAWIGYLRTRPRPAWDFSQGRYEAYQNLRGRVQSPQTGQEISDAEVGLLGGLLNAAPDDVRASMGAALAAKRMAHPRGFQAPASVEGVEMRGTLRAARTGAIDDRLGLLKAALTRCASVPRAWDVVAESGRRGELPASALDEWARAVDRMCGSAFQDFSFDMLYVLIKAEKDAEAAHRMWEWAFGRFRGRPDLASAVRLEQGAVWAGAGRPDLAWSAYEDVIGRYVNDGPMVVFALRGMRDLLDKAGKRGAFLATVEDAAKRVKQPGQMGGAFRSQSNYYKIHAMLAEELDRAGRGGDAAKVRERVGIRG